MAIRGPQHLPVIPPKVFCDFAPSGNRIQRKVLAGRFLRLFVVDYTGISEPFRKEDHFMGKFPAAPKAFSTGALALCLLGILIFLLFSPVRDFEFVNWDDDLHVYQNTAIHSFRGQDILSWFKNPYVGLYIPVPIMTYALDYYFCGNQPGAYHLTNLWLHIANVLLVFLILKLFSGELWPAFLGALLFGIHPVQVESVVWISERKNLLCALFFFASFFIFAYSRRNQAEKKFPALAVFVFFLLALLSKVTAVAGLAVFAAYDYFYVGKSTGKAKGFYLFGTVLAVALSVLTLMLYPRVFRILTEGKWLEICFAQAGKFLFYLKHVFFPLGLRVLYPEQNFFLSGNSGKIICGAFLLLLAGALVYGIVRKKEYGFWILWFLSFLAPVVTLFPVPVGDRHLYLPLLGCIALGILIGKKRKILLPGFLIAAIFLLIPITRVQIHSWRDSGTLWGRILQYEPDSFQGTFKLAGFFERRKDFGTAARFYEELIRKYPDAFPYPYVNLYNLYSLLKQEAQAKRVADTFGKVYPSLPGLDLLYQMMLRWKKNPEKGMAFFDRALALRKGNAGAYEIAGDIFLKDGNDLEAFRCFEAALKTGPGSEGLREKRDDAGSRILRGEIGGGGDDE